ncbi:hypothetical protein BH18ACT5_BH18ACT5_07670 [soil metagenome]
MWTRRLAWTLCILALVLVAIQAPGRVAPIVPGPDRASEWLFLILVLLCAVLGALIISKQRQNTVGWLLLLIGVSNPLWGLAERHVQTFAGPPADAPFLLILALWVVSLSWITLIFPMFHLLQVFPTGRLLSSRWRWVVILEWTLIAFVVGVVIVNERIGPEVGWTVENPVGFIAVDPFTLPIVNFLWNAALVVLPLAGATSMVMRFRRSRAEQRQQIKLFVLAALAIVVSLALTPGDGGGGWLEVLFPASLLLIPITIAFAILRKGLFDIDLVIRRTVVYTLLTGVLTLVYLGSIFLTQNLFGLRERASWQVAGSTLLVTALFSPLRRRIQRVIDRRLFRRRYDAQLVVESFAGAAQAQSDLGLLSADLIEVVHQTIQPAHTRLWIRT